MDRRRTGPRYRVGYLPRTETRLRGRFAALGCRHKSNAPARVQSPGAGTGEQGSDAAIRLPAWHHSKSDVRGASTAEEVGRGN